MNDMRIVILGKTGAGKSSLGNTILGENVFKIGHTAMSRTEKCQTEKNVSGRRITVIDTPGFFDTNRSEEEMKPEIVKCMVECAPGPHAFLIVLKVEKFTKHEKEVVDKIQEYFSQEAFKHAVVVFTHGDQLVEGQTIEEFVQQYKGLSDLVSKCGGRYHVVDNKYWNNNQQDEYRNNNYQVEKLLKTIEAMVDKGGYYTNEMLQDVERKIQEEKKKIRQSSQNMSEKEIGEMAKSNVSSDLVKKIAGVSTGVLLGILFGAIVFGLLTSALAPGATVGAVVAACAVGGAVGAVVGGCIGYDKADEPGSVAEVVVNAGAAVTSAAKTLCKKCLEILSTKTTNATCQQCSGEEMCHLKKN